MANPEHLKILKQGVEVWNRWREENPEIRPDLTGADLAGMNFEHIDFSEARLSGAFMARAGLVHARLSGAQLGSAHLASANLTQADLTGANLAECVLTNAILIEANLRGAELRNAGLVSVDLRRANLDGARMLRTTIDGSDLSETECIESVVHQGPSTIGTDALERTAKGLRIRGRRQADVENFYRAAGVSEHIIEYFHSFIVQPGLYYNCSISYSRADESFASRLREHLQDRGIRCWLDEHGLKPSDHFPDVVNDAIRTHDKVLLCCSKASLQSWWVQDEIRIAQKRERQEGRMLIVPVDLDGYLFEWEGGLANDLVSRLAADFAGWEHDSTRFENGLQRIVKALSTHAAAQELRKRTMRMIKDVGLLSRRISRSSGQVTEQEIESVLVTVLRESGVRAMRTSSPRDFGADLAVWIDQLDLELGNPILIEIKLRIANLRSAGRILDESRRYVEQIAGGSVLVVYNEGLDPHEINKKFGSANVIFVRLPDLLEQLRTKPLDQALLTARGSE